MKIAVIHGETHKGSTYHMAHAVAEKIGGDIKAFFLPRDFGEFCNGCTRCFQKRMFHILRLMQMKSWNKTDSDYWQERGWLDKKRPWQRRAVFRLLFED